MLPGMALARAWFWFCQGGCSSVPWEYLGLPGPPVEYLGSTWGVIWSCPAFLGTESVDMELPGLPRNRICSYGAAWWDDFKLGHNKRTKPPSDHKI